jgi:murein DD-endopeptidase MepM/ murein hydrolase activator NlpD
MFKLKSLSKLLLFISIFISVSCSNNSNDMIKEIENQDVEVQTFLFGVDLSKHKTIQNSIKSGESISILLSRYGLASDQVHQSIVLCDNVFDLRKIRQGRPYFAFLNKQNEKLEYFIYEHSNLEYLKFNFVDSISVTFESKEVQESTRISSGIIKSSLWNAVTAIGVNFELALKLSEIYAWTIDFYALQKNDKFTVVYDEVSIDNKSERIGNIKYAIFEHNGKERYAFAYKQDSVVEFFNEKGENLRGAFLKAPLRFTRISSKFSNSRMHPVLRIRRPHHGVDYAAPTGTPVMSVGDGEVIHTGYSGGAGHMVKIRHNGVYSTAYLHLSKYGQGVKKGTRVRQGQVIGYVGSTGLSSGPHLDFRFYKNGSAIDPLSVESPPIDPIRKENMDDFLKNIEFPKMLLDSLKGENLVLPKSKHGIEFIW